MDSPFKKFMDKTPTPIPITRELWRRSSVSHQDSIQEHQEELLLYLLTKGYQKCQEEIRQSQSTRYSYTDNCQPSKFEHDVKVLQEDLRYILDVNWNP